MMSELHHTSNIELSDFFRLTAPTIVQMEDVGGLAGSPEGRRSAGGRRTHHRAAAAGRPAGSGARRNERERNRVRQVNAGFDRLRDHVPQGRRNRKLSKVDTLRAAVEYIGHLQSVLRRADGDVTDENFVTSGNTDDVINSWYLDTRFCDDVERVPTDSSMMQLLVSPEDLARALVGGHISTSGSGTDHRLTVDVGALSSPTADGLIFAGSGSCGGCTTPESVDPEVTSSSVDDPLDHDDAEQLLNLATWLT